MALWLTPSALAAAVCGGAAAPRETAAQMKLLSSRISTNERRYDMTYTLLMAAGETVKSG
jgi:hypothetical protein